MAREGIIQVLLASSSKCCMDQEVQITMGIPGNQYICELTMLISKLEELPAISAKNGICF